MYKYIYLILVISICLFNLVGCDSESHELKTTRSDTTSLKKDTFFIASYDVTSIQTSNLFDSGKVTGVIKDLSLDEVSGICVSSKQGMLWMEEDSGNENKLYLVDSSGNNVGSYWMPFSDRDWEDIAIATSPIDGKQYIYLADIGDNKVIYNEKYIYRFKEPLISDTVPFSKTLVSKEIDVIRFKYPDGNRNAEAVMIDPKTNDIYIISKEDQASIYVVRYPQSLTNINTLIKIGELPISTVTAADISSDGTEVLIKNYQQVFYWRKKENEDFSSLLRTKPERLKYVPEPQGEAICWVKNGSGYYTTSEIVDDVAPVIIFHQRN